MNGPIAFARTLRALDADDFRISNIALFLAMALLAGWTAWLFAARIPQYETAQDARLQGPEIVIADFPLSARPRIRPAQRALVETGGPPLRAEVASIDSAVRDGMLQVELRLSAGSEQTPASRVTVQIEVERVSPASLLLRAIGRGGR
ncbi:MAG TPA: hypothetical protein VEV17_15735 [Bryobacteraceae bacterium]|nr:hypothetical protein [Bryobacteraceae bacterium]